MGQGQDMEYVLCVVSGERACVNNVYSVCSSEGSASATLNPKKDLEITVAQRSVCGCKSIHPTVSSPCGQVHKKERRLKGERSDLKCFRSQRRAGAWN